MLQIGRGKAAGLLEYLHDDVGPKLLKTDRYKILRPKTSKRKPAGPRVQIANLQADTGKLTETVQGLEKLFQEEAEGNAARLASAAFPFERC